MRIFALITFLFLVNTSNAQGAKVQGVIKDSIAGIPGATVMLVGAQDSILKLFALTDENGLFSLDNVKPGEYLFKASYYGYETYTSDLTITPETEDTFLDAIELLPPVQNIDEVVVKAEFIPIQIKGDTIEYDPRAFETDEHDAVEELLKQLPGVEVAPDGTIKAQGRDVGKVLVDGEEFFGDDPKIATKNLPAEAIKKVQIFDKQSDVAEFTGIDDGNETTTINLKLKASHKQGGFGNIEGGGGVDQPKSDEDYRYQAKGNIHYFRGKLQMSLIGLGNNVNETGFSFQDYINFQGGVSNLMNGGRFEINDDLAINGPGSSNSGYLSTLASGANFHYKPSKKTKLSANVFLNRFNNRYIQNINRTTFYTDSSIIASEETNRNSDRINNKYKLRFEHKIDSSQTIDIGLSGSWNRSDHLNDRIQNNLRSGDTLTSNFNTELEQEGSGFDINGSANYRKKFKRLGNYTTLDLSYDIDENNELTLLDYISNLYSSGGNTTSATYQTQNNLLNTSNLNSKWILSQGLSKRSFIQLGLAHIRSTESRDKRVSDIVGGTPILNEFFSANGLYAHSQNQGELRYKFVSKKLKASALARYQHASMAARDILPSSPSFHYFLPAISLDYEARSGLELELNYTTNIKFPTLNELQDLPNNLNPSEIILGNTDLTPEYNHTLFLSMRRFNQFNFSHFSTMLIADYVQNNITYSQNVNEFLVREITPENLGDEKRLSAHINGGASVNPIKTKFSLSNMTTASSGQVKINSNMDIYTSLQTQSTLTLENTKKRVIDFRIGGKYTWSTNTYQNNTNFNNTFQNWSYFSSLKLKFKKRVTVSADLNHYFYPDFEQNQDQIQLNSRIALNLLESRKLQVYVAGYDLLNQNIGLTQNYTQNIYEEVRTTTLSRYFMVGLKYSFRQMGQGQTTK